MNYWIFQSRQDRFDLRNPQAIQPNKPDTWDATRYRGYMRLGDIVFFWMAGPRELRGIYGWGELTSEPYLGGRRESFGVDVIYRERLTRHVPVAEIVAHPDLRDLQIIDIPIGTNFLIKPEEARAIACLIRPPDKAPEIEP